jgi:glucose/galactose transporter
MTETVQNRRKEYVIPIIIIGVLFFVFGFVTWLNATLIPYLQISCELTTFESYLVTFAFYISYFVMAFPSSLVLKKTGFKNGMSLGLVVMAVGALIFVPAAMSRTYTWFLFGLFIQGTGLALLQTASNPYVTILGPIESAAKRISIMGVANKFAGILSPIILGAVVLEGIDSIKEKIVTMDAVEKAAELDMLSHKVIMPYVVMAVVLVLLALMVRYSALPEVEGDDEETDTDEVKRTNILQYPYLWFGVVALFFYVGAEVVAVDTLISYGNSLGFDLAEAKFFSSFTLGGMIVGYFFGIFLIPKFISQQKALTYFSILGVIFTLIAIMTDGYTSILFIAALGFANSIMWPAIWPLAIDGLGKFIKTGSALLIMAIAGGASIPLLYGFLAGMENVGNRLAYIILVPCYLIILYFATKGHKIGKVVKTSKKAVEL